MNTAAEKEYTPEYITEAAIRAAAMEAVEAMREIARHDGWMSDDEIESVISASRQERRQRKNRESCD